MNRSLRILLCLLLNVMLGAGGETWAADGDGAKAQAALDFTHTEDLIYGRKHGMALTMDCFAPKQRANGRAIIWCVSGGWFSSKDYVNAIFAKPFLDRGYTVFQVVHGSQPRYTIPEVIEDMHRAVRYVKIRATRFQIDPDFIGIGGGSAGGHLSLMMGTAPKSGSLFTLDPVERQSSKVAAVACFFPPTDFLNYGKEGESALGVGRLKDFKAPFDFHELDPKTNCYVQVADEAKRLAIGKTISPAQFVTRDAAPTLIIHGDADQLVPIQQSQWLIAKMKACQVPCELIVRKGAGHSGLAFANDGKFLVDWFDKHLLKKSSDKSP